MIRLLTPHDEAFLAFETPDEECQYLLRAWDEGAVIGTCEMGGIGPGYEQCIHIIAFEMLRAMLKEKPSREPEEFVWAKLDPIFDEHLVDTIEKLGPSGAQWGAAKSIASMFYLQGYREGYNKIPKDRLIQISNNFPTL